MPVLILNPGLSTITLPMPFQGALEPGHSFYADLTKAQAAAVLGPDHGLSITTYPNYAGPFDTFRTGAAKASSTATLPGAIRQDGVTLYARCAGLDVFAQPAAAGEVYVPAASKGDSNPAEATAQPDVRRPVVAVLGAGWVSTAAVTLTLAAWRNGQAVTAYALIPADSSEGDQFAFGRTAVADPIVDAFDMLNTVGWTSPAGWTAGAFTVESADGLGLAVPEGAISVTVSKEAVWSAGSPAAQVNQTIDPDHDNHYGVYVPTETMDGDGCFSIGYTYLAPLVDGA